jgi:hypothetical protein
MIGYLLLLVFAILVTVIFLGLTIYSLVKKKKKTAIISLSVFVLFVLISVFCGYTYVKKSIDYVASDEFQNETKKKAESLGKTYGNTVSGAAKGFEETLDDESIAKLANKIAVTTGKVVKTTNAGLDSTIGKTNILSDKSITDAGIEIGRAQENVEGSQNNIGLYLDFKSNFKGILRLTAYDQQSEKMDAIEVNVDEKIGAGKVVVFKFKYAPPGVNGFCVLTKVK